jgi:Zn-dependent M28 family amino/carboxypeptidase
MEGRRTGTRGNEKAARFIAAEMKAIGLVPLGDSAYFQKVAFAKIAGRRPMKVLDNLSDLDSIPADRRITSNNVIGMLPGSDPALKDQVVVIAAHYDAIGIVTPVNGDSIVNGADDDGSGVAVIMSVARAMKSGPLPKRTIVFITTTGEEQGILGTQWYVKHPAFPLSKMVAEMEVEMAGRPDSLAGGRGKTWMTGYDRSTMGDMLKAAGIPIVPDPYPQYKFFERSDNIVFARAGIPAHTLSTYNLHQDYHAPSDDLSRIDFAHLTEVARAALAATRLLADGPAPQWKPGGQPAPSSR